MRPWRRREGIKRARRVVRAWGMGEDWGFFKVLIHTRHPCSCMGCSHSRRWYGVSRQECRAEESYRAQLEEIEE